MALSLPARAQQILIDSLQAELQQVSANNIKRASLLAKLARAWWYVNPDSSVALGERCLSITEASNIPKLRLEALNAIGVANNLMGNYEAGLSYFRHTMTISEAIKDSQALATAYNNIGITLETTGQYDEALTFYFSALKLREAINDQKGIAGTLGNIGIVYGIHKDYTKAIGYYERALAAYQALNDQVGIANTYNSIGIAYKNLEDYSRSLDYYLKSLQVKEIIGNKGGIATSLHNIAVLYQKMGEYDQSLAFHQRSLGLQRELKDREGVGNALLDLSLVYMALKDRQRALTSAHDALAEFKAVGIRNGERKAYRNIAEIHLQFGDYEQAFPFYQKAEALKDSLFNERKAEQLAEVETKYETAKKEQQLALQEKEIHVLEQEKALKTRTNIALGMGIVLLLVLGWLVWYNQRQKIRLSRLAEEKLAAENRLLAEEQERTRLALEHQARELTNFALHIVQKNEAIMRLHTYVEEQLEKEPSVDHKNLLKPLDQQIDQIMNLDRDREKFEMQVNAMHQRFFQELEQQFPDLTENEKRLCALLRLDFSSKDIAAVYNIATKSIEMYRYRLRKKFDLGSEENLSVFLKSI